MAIEHWGNVGKKLASHIDDSSPIGRSGQVFASCADIHLQTLLVAWCVCSCATMHGMSCSYSSTLTPSYLLSRRRAALPIVQHIRYAVPVKLILVHPEVMLQAHTAGSCPGYACECLCHWCRCCHADTSTSEPSTSGGQQSQPCSLGRRQALALGLSTALLTVRAALSGTQHDLQYHPKSDTESAVLARTLTPKAASSQAHAGKAGAAAGLKQVVDGGVTILVPGSSASSLSPSEKKVLQPGRLCWTRIHCWTAHAPLNTTVKCAAGLSLVAGLC